MSHNCIMYIKTRPFVGPLYKHIVTTFTICYLYCHFFVPYVKTNKIDIKNCKSIIIGTILVVVDSFFLSLPL
jgi:hypothetical protein